jgi:hypothetical protein
MCLKRGIYFLQYTVIRNSLTNYKKSVHLIGAKDGNVLIETVQVYFASSFPFPFVPLQRQ